MDMGKGARRGFELMLVIRQLGGLISSRNVVHLFNSLSIYNYIDRIGIIGSGIPLINMMT